MEMNVIYLYSTPSRFPDLACLALQGRMRSRDSTSRVMIPRLRNFFRLK